MPASFATSFHQHFGGRDLRLKKRWAVQCHFAFTSTSAWAPLPATPPLFPEARDPVAPPAGPQSLLIALFEARGARSNQGRRGSNIGLMTGRIEKVKNVGPLHARSLGRALVSGWCLLLFPQVHCCNGMGLVTNVALRFGEPQGGTLPGLGLGFSEVGPLSACGPNGTLVTRRCVF